MGTGSSIIQMWMKGCSKCMSRPCTGFASMVCGVGCLVPLQCQHLSMPHSCILGLTLQHVAVQTVLNSQQVLRVVILQQL
jgi:hypothetical protein